MTDVVVVVVVAQVHIKARFILNGVCVRWRGWLDQDRLDGVGCVEFDEEAGRVSRHSATCWPLFDTSLCTVLFLFVSIEFGGNRGRWLDRWCHRCRPWSRLFLGRIFFVSENRKKKASTALRSTLAGSVEQVSEPAHVAPHSAVVPRFCVYRVFFFCLCCCRVRRADTQKRVQLKSIGADRSRPQ